MPHAVIHAHGHMHPQAGVDHAALAPPERAAASPLDGGAEGSGAGSGSQSARPGDVSQAGAQGQARSAGAPSHSPTRPASTQPMPALRTAPLAGGQSRERQAGHQGRTMSGELGTHSPAKTGPPGKMSSADVARSRAREMAALARSLTARGARLPVPRFDARSAELLRFAAACGLLEVS